MGECNRSGRLYAAQPPMHPTPLRVDEIGAILSVGRSETVFSIYWFGAGDGPAVGRLISVYGLMTHVLFAPQCSSI